MADANTSDGPLQGNGRSLAKDLLRVLPLCLFFIIVAVMLRNEAVRNILFDIEKVQSILQGADSMVGRWKSAALFIAAGSLLVSLGVPRLWISTLAGAIYGSVIGIGLGLLPSVIGSAAVYQMGRKFLGALAQRMLGDRVGLWQQRFQENALWWVLYARLVPFANATLTSLLCGSCKVPFRPFLAASFLGFIPLASVFTIFGSGGIKGNYYQIGIGIILIAAMVLLRRFLKRFRPDQRRPGAKQAGKPHLRSREEPS